MILKRGNDFSNFLWNMEIKNAEYWIKHLELNPHPEGGYYKETYRAHEQIEKESLPQRFTGPRNFSTAIYFLLRSSDRSVFHRIKSDELWHFYAGSMLEIFVLRSGALQVFKLGSNLLQSESLQVLIPAESWFAAKVSQPGSHACGLHRGARLRLRRLRNSNTRRTSQGVSHGKRNNLCTYMNCDHKISIDEKRY
jgi:predicted cupin superfamily sugar epimerase